MNTSELRETLARQTRRSQAHAGLSTALEGFPAELAGRQVAGHRHTAWQQVEHMRLTAEDLIAYCEDPKYEARDWPDGYWPESPEPPSSFQPREGPPQGEREGAQRSPSRGRCS